MEDYRRHFRRTLLVRTWKIRLSMIFLFVFYIGIWFFGVLPVSSSMWAEFYKLCWVLQIIAVVVHAFFNHMRAMGDDYSLGGLVTSLLFLTQIIGHLTILWDSFCMRKKRPLIYEKFKSLDTRLLSSNLEVSFDISECTYKLALTIFAILIQLIFWHSFISWTVFKVSTTATALYWYGFLSSLALQFRMLEFLMSIASVNERLSIVCRNINVIGERNLRRLFKPLNKIEAKAKKENYYQVEPCYMEEDDERQLIVLKSVHNDIFGIFQIINDCYGWSLLAFTALYFTDFVTNSYWIVLSMITQGRDNLAFLQNGGFLWIVVVMLSTICGHCQRSHDFSRQIGCLIFKLVKPMGNKRYNDLVSEFSLQTMHQQFVITAKEFFSLNLNLLGSMVAAIVTYLVILIQFMFTEKSNLERSLTTTVSPLNVTATTSATDLIFRNFTPSTVKT